VEELRMSPLGLAPQSLRVVSVLAGLVAVLCVLGAAVLPAFFDDSVDTPDLPVSRGAALALPGGSGGGVLTLYAAAPPDAGPSESDLGCRVTNEQGRTSNAFLTVLTSSDPRTVGGQVLRPVLKISRVRAGLSLTCTGPAIDRLAPVYLVGTGGEQPLAARVVVLGAMIMGALMMATISLVTGLAARSR
jgi:hypothetical protein